MNKNYVHYLLINMISPVLLHSIVKITSSHLIPEPAGPSYSKYLIVELGNHS